MKKISFLFFLLSLLYSCGGSKRKDSTVVKDSVASAPVKKPSTKAGVVNLTELKHGNQDAFAEATGRIGDTVYFCGYKGRVEYFDSLKNQRVFLFDLKTEFLVDKIYMSPCGADHFFVVWQETDHVGARSNTAMFKTGEPKPIWKKRFGAINPGIPARDGDYAYLTCVGFIGKIMLADGRFAWKRDSLYTVINQRYQRFEAPQVYDDKVLFIDYPIPGLRPNRDTIKADPLTGESIK